MKGLMGRCTPRIFGLEPLLFKCLSDDEDADDDVCSGLSLEHSTDMTSLSAELNKVERQLRELTSSSRTRYAPKQRRDELRCELDCYVTEKDMIQTQVDSLRRGEVVLRTAVEAAKTFVKTQPPHQTVADAVLLALHNNHTLYGMSLTPYATHNVDGFVGWSVWV